MDRTPSRILPETEGNIFCAEVAERVTMEDYTTIFLQPITEILSRHGDVRLVLVYKGPFYGWDLDAASFDFSQILEKGNQVKKAALVAPPENVALRWNTMRPLFGGEIRIFDRNDGYAAALEWIRQ